MRSTRALLLLGTALGCARAESGPLSAAAGRPPALVARRGDFEKRILLTGEVDVVAAAELKIPRLHSPKAPIRWLIEGESVEVKRGQKIAEIDNTVLATQLHEKELAVAQAEVDVQRQQWQDALTESDRQLDVDRMSAACKRAQIDADLPPNILPKRDYLEKQLAWKHAQADLERAQQALKAQRTTAEMELGLKRLALESVEREVRWAQETITALTIRAPSDGLLMIGDHPEGRKFQVGDDVMMGTTIARMPNQSRLRVRAFLSDVDDGRIETGMPAAVTLDAYPDRTFAGQVAEISPVAVEVSERSPRRVFKVGVDLDETAAAAMRPGLSARIEVVAARLSGKILVPRSALDFSAMPYRASTADGHDLEVTLGGCNAAACVAETGVAEGTLLKRVVP